MKVVFFSNADDFSNVQIASSNASPKSKHEGGDKNTLGDVKFKCF